MTHHIDRALAGHVAPDATEADRLAAVTAQREEAYAYIDAIHRARLGVWL